MAMSNRLERPPPSDEARGAAINEFVTTRAEWHRQQAARAADPDTRIAHRTMMLMLDDVGAFAAAMAKAEREWREQDHAYWSQERAEGGG